MKPDKQRIQRAGQEVTMEILILPGALAAIVWAVALFNQFAKSKTNLLPAMGLAVVIAGSVCGFEFFHLSGGPIPITLDRMLLAGLLGLCALFYLRGGEDLRPINRVDILMLAFVAVNAVSALTHDWRFLDNMPASRLLFFYLLPLLLYFVMRNVRVSKTDLSWIAMTLGAFGVYLALTAIAETRELSAFVFPRYIMSSAETEFLGRGRGPFLNPVANGIFMVVCCCSLWMQWPGNSRRGQSIIIGLTAVMATGIFCTLTRSIWLSFFASAGVFIWYPVSRQTKGLLIIVATVIAVVSFPTIGEKIFSFKRDKQVTQAEMEKSAALRPMFAIVAWKMFQDRPLLGCGFGQYAKAKYPYLQDPHSGQPLAATKHFMQHNVFLAYLTEMGVVGLAALVTTLLMMATSGWKLWQNKELELMPRMFGLLMIVLLINYTINGMFHDVSIIPMQNMLLFFLFGLIHNILTSTTAFRLAPRQVPSTRSGAESAPLVRRRNLSPTS